MKKTLRTGAFGWQWIRRPDGSNTTPTVDPGESSQFVRLAHRRQGEPLRAGSEQPIDIRIAQNDLGPLILGELDRAVHASGSIDFDELDAMAQVRGKTAHAQLIDHRARVRPGVEVLAQQRLDGVPPDPPVRHRIADLVGPSMK